MKRHQTNEANARHVGSAVAGPADGSDGELGKGVDAHAQEAVTRRAYELYLERGAEAGRDLEDWFRAEAELREGRR